MRAVGWGLKDFLPFWFGLVLISNGHWSVRGPKGNIIAQ